MSYDFEALQPVIRGWKARGRFIEAGGCWIWRGPVNSFGYAAAKVQGVQGAHRVMWLYLNRRLPAGTLRNECGNPLCLRPAHWRECVKPVSRLAVRRELMRTLHGQGMGIGEIADRVGCSRQAVGRFVRALPMWTPDEFEGNLDE